MDKIIKAGVIGLGQRGMQLIEPMLKMDDVEITAVCDVYEDRIKNAADSVFKAKGTKPFQTGDYREVLELGTLDAVVIATSWECHIEIAIESMKKGIFTAMEVGGTYNLQECFDLVQAQEETGTPFFFLENCCYGQRELMCFNMAKQGDIVTTIITCENGETITLTLDTTLPRIYSRNFTVHGTKGMYQEDGDYVFLEKDFAGDISEIDTNPQKIWKNADEYAKEYDNDLWKHKSDGMIQSGHGGMDYLVLRSMINAAKGKTLPAVDVYDAASWMCITALSEVSVKNGNIPVEIPDFTGGKYKNRTDKSTGKYAL